MRRVARVAEPKDLRRLLSLVVPQMIDAHIASIDRVSAEFLLGRMSKSDFDVFRSPKPSNVE